MAPRWAGPDRATPRRDPGAAGISRVNSLDSGSGANSQKPVPRTDFVLKHARPLRPPIQPAHAARSNYARPRPAHRGCVKDDWRSEEHTSELQSLMRISYAVFCLKKKKYRD